MKMTISAAVMAVLVLLGVTGHEALGRQEQSAYRFKTITTERVEDGSGGHGAEGYNEYTSYMDDMRYASYYSKPDPNDWCMGDDPGYYSLSGFILWFSSTGVIVFDEDSNEMLMTFTQDPDSTTYTTDTYLESVIEDLKTPIPVWITKTYTVSTANRGRLTVDVESNGGAHTYEVHVYNRASDRILTWWGRESN